MGSLGRKLKEGLKLVKMNDLEVVVAATIKSFDSFSAHADSGELVRYARAVMSETTSSRSIFLLHGEETGGIALKSLLDHEFQGTGIEVFLPIENETIKVKMK